jgi:hypothetical protein
MQDSTSQRHLTLDDYIKELRTENTELKAEVDRLLWELFITQPAMWDDD